MLQINDIFTLPTMQWNQVIWYVILILLVSVFFIQKLLNIYTERKLGYFLPTSTNVISYISSMTFVLLGYIHLGDITINFVLISLAVMILSSTSLIDIHYQELPNEYNLLLTIISLVYLGFNFHNYEYILMGGIISFLLYFIIMILTGSVGGGDVKMSFAIGALIGTPFLLVWIMMTFFSGAIMAILLMLTKKLSRKDVFAFGPFMAFSSIYLILFFI